MASSTGRGAQVSAVLEDISELSRLGVDVAQETVVIGRNRKTKVRLSPSNIFAYGQTQSWVILSGGGNVDLGSLELVVGMRPIYTSGNTSRRNLNGATDYKVGRTASNPVSVYGEDLNVEVPTAQTPLICMYNPWCLIREIEILIGGSQVRRFNGSTITLALRKCLDRLVNGVPNGAPVFEFLPIEGHLFSSSDIRSKLTLNRFIATDTVEIRLDLLDGLVLKEGTYMGGRGVLTVNVTWENENDCQKAFLRNPAAPNPTNGIRIQPEISSQRLEYNVQDRSSELSARLFQEAALLGGIPRAFNFLHTLVSTENGAQQAKFAQQNAALRGVMMIPFYDPEPSSAPAAGHLKRVRYGRYVGVTNWKNFSVTLGSQKYSLSSNSEQSINFRGNFISSNVKHSYENYRRFAAANLRSGFRPLSEESYIQNTPFPCVWFDEVGRQGTIGNHQYSNVLVDWEIEGTLPTDTRIVVVAMFETTYSLSLEGAVTTGLLEPISLGGLPAYVANQIRVANQVPPLPGSNNTA